jgi:hypothetical protein
LTSTTAEDFCQKAPADQIQRLRDLTKDQTSEFSIQSCAANGNSTPEAFTDQTLLFSGYSEVTTVPAESCPESVRTKLTEIIGTQGLLHSCQLVEAAPRDIPAASIANLGWTNQSDTAACTNAIVRVCSDSSGAFRKCEEKSGNRAYRAAETRTASVTANSDLSCSTSCANAPGACGSTTNTQQTLTSYATNLGGFSCSASSVNSTETYSVPVASRVETIDSVNPLTCESLCNAVPKACPGNQNPLTTLSGFNKACSVKKSNLVPAGTPVSVDLGVSIALEMGESFSCQSLCTQPKLAAAKVCGAGVAPQMSVDQYVAQTLKGRKCETKPTSVPVPERTESEIKNAEGVVLAEANQTKCSAGFTFKQRNLLTNKRVSLIPVAGSQNIVDYIKQKLLDVVGEQLSLVSAFITLEGQSDATKNTSFGRTYKSLVEAVGRGGVHDIKLESYQAALQNLSSVLANKLERSLRFSEVGDKKEIRRVWRKPAGAAEWGQPLPQQDWSSSGGTLTLSNHLNLSTTDEIKIEFY